VPAIRAASLNATVDAGEQVLAPTRH